MKQQHTNRYQSKLWNECAEQYISIYPEIDFDADFPLIGFDSNYNDKVYPIIFNILKREGITERDFILRSFPNLSLEGGNRKVYVKPSDVTINGKATGDIAFGVSA